MPQDISIGIVIPSYNEGMDLIQTLHTIFSQSTPFAEVVIVDDSSDGTDGLVKSIFGDRVKLIHRDRPLGRCSARNLGISLSHSDILVILNADVCLPSSFCEQIKGKYLSTNCDALGVDLEITNTDHDYTRYLYALHLSQNKADIGWTEGFSIRRSMFLKTKGFPDGYPLSILAGEDAEFVFDLQRSGAKICFDFDIKVTTTMPEDAKIINDQIRGRASLRTWHFVYNKSIGELIIRSILKQIRRVFYLLTIVPLVWRIYFLWRHFNHGFIDLSNYGKYEIYIDWLRTDQEWRDILMFIALYTKKSISLIRILTSPASQLKALHK